MDNSMLILSVAGMLGSGYSCIQIVKAINELQKKILRYKETPIYSISELKQLIQSKKLKQGIQVFLSGEIECQNKVMDNAIWKEQRIYDVYINNKKILRNILQNGVPIFYMKDQLEMAKVWRSSSMNVKPALRYLNHHEIPIRLNFIQQIINFLFRCFNVLKFQKPIFKGFKIAELMTEYGIKSGDYCSLLGDIYFENSQIIVKNVKHILRDKTQLIAFLQQIYRKKNILFMFMFAAFLFMSYSTGKNLINFVQQIIKLKRLERLNKLRNINLLEMKFKEQYDCLICLSRPRDVIFKPCKHLAICNTCYKQLKNQKCPICKTNIQDTIDIYFA